MKRILTPIVSDTIKRAQHTVVIPPGLPQTCHVRNRFLDVAHGHPRDHQIFFDSGVNNSAHDYYVDWDGSGNFQKNNSRSVTSMCHAFFDEFDADKVIRGMMNGKNWHKSKYYGMTPEAIKEQWSNAGKEAREKGTEMHDFIDRYYNGECSLSTVTEDQVELCFFKEFQQQIKGELEPYRSEWFVFTDNETRITGAVDMTYVDKAHMRQLWTKNKGATDTLHIQIYDWKRSGNIRTFSRERGYYPCEALNNCNFYHYSLQLNLYKYILENYYHDVQWNGHTYKNISVDCMYLCVMHPNNKKPLRYLCPRLSDEVETMVDLRRSSLTRVREGLPELFPFDKTQPHQHEEDFY